MISGTFFKVNINAAEIVYLKWLLEVLCVPRRPAFAVQKQFISGECYFKVCQLMARCAWPPPLKVGECGAGRIDRRRLAHDLAFLTTFLNTNYVLWYSVQALHRMKRPIGGYGSVIKTFPCCVVFVFGTVFTCCWFRLKETGYVWMCSSWKTKVHNNVQCTLQTRRENILHIY